MCLLACVIFVAAGCEGTKNSGGNSSDGTTKAPSANGQASSDNAKKPPAKVDMNTHITLKVYVNYTASMDDYHQLFGDFWDKKYPNITFEPVHIKSEGKTELSNMTELAAQKNIPDIFLLPDPSNIQDTLVPMNLVFDLNGLIKKYNYDLSRLDKDALQLVKNQSNAGEINALPIHPAIAALFYNKDLFDKYGAPYPTNGMTWQQAFELGKQLTRSDNGVQYRGFDPGLWTYLWEEYGLNAYSDQTGKATLQTDPKWKTILQFLQTVYQYPGNAPAKIAQGRGPFMNGQVGMIPWAVYLPPFLKARPEGLNFDIVSIPTWGDAKGHGIAPGNYTAAINPLSKYKDQAFEAVTHLLSDEVQTKVSRLGFPPAINLQGAKDQFGLDLPNVEGLHLKNAFFNQLTPAPKVNGQFETIAQTYLIKTTIPDVSGGKVDINTALRQAQEAVDQEIAAAKAK
jgi:multiple sugar transport system substrate-binding protein